MKCPFRVNILFHYELCNSKPILSSQKEEYPECDKDECPFYTTNYVNSSGCSRANVEGVCDD